jgi:hypothetical protein
LNGVCDLVLYLSNPFLLPAQDMIEKIRVLDFAAGVFQLLMFV